jgi:DivIVA domain-containing protein
MPLTPLDAEKHNFRTVMRGYDKLEVEQFRAALMRALEEYIDLLGRQRMRIGEMEAEIARYKESEELIRGSVVLAQRTSEEIIAASKAKAEAVLAQAHADGQDLMRQYSRVEADRERFEHQFHALLTGYLHQLETRSPGLSSGGASVPLASSSPVPANQSPVSTDSSGSLPPSPLAPVAATLPSPSSGSTGLQTGFSSGSADSAAGMNPASTDTADSGLRPPASGLPSRPSAFDAWHDPQPFSAEPRHEASAPPIYSAPPPEFASAAQSASEGSERDSDSADFSRALERA